MLPNKRAFFVNLTRNNVEDSRFQHESLAIGYLSRVLEGMGLETQQADCQVTPEADEAIVERILAFSPVLVGVCASVQELFPRISEFVKLLRTRGCEAHLIVGGLFATTAAKEILETLSEIDSVCVGEGDQVICDLAKRLLLTEAHESSAAAEVRQHDQFAGIPGLAYRHDGRIVDAERIAFVPDMDKLPYPNRKSINVLKALGRRCCLMASRGCVARCNFCSSETIMSMGSPRRFRSPGNVVGEMIELYEKHEVSRFRFNDPIFIGPGPRGAQWGFEFCKEIDRRGYIGIFDMAIHLRCIEAMNEELMSALAKAGVSKVVLGVESASERILRWMRKPSNVNINHAAVEVLKKNNIGVEMAFIFFVPPMGLDDVITNVDFLEKYNELNPFTLTSVMEVYIGCSAETALAEEGNLERESWWDLGRWAFSEPEMIEFWDIVRPIMACFSVLKDELHLLDVHVQKLKMREAGSYSQQVLEDVTNKTAGMLATAYRRVIAQMRSGDSSKAYVDGVVEQFNRLSEKLRQTRQLPIQNRVKPVAEDIGNEQAQ